MVPAGVSKQKTPRQDSQLVTSASPCFSVRNLPSAGFTGQSREDACERPKLPATVGECLTDGQPRCQAQQPRRYRISDAHLIDQ